MQLNSWAEEESNPRPYDAIGRDAHGKVGEEAGSVRVMMILTM